MNLLNNHQKYLSVLAFAAAMAVAGLWLTVRYINSISVSAQSVPALCDINSIYVATNGNDTTGNGSQGNPFRTVKKGVNSVVGGRLGLFGTVQPGGTVCVKAGTYYELVNVSKSGITITGERGSNGEYLTVIDGGVSQVTGWVPAPEIGAGVWKAPSPSWIGPYTGLTLYPSSLEVDGKTIWKINESYSRDGEVANYSQTWQDVLSTGADFTFLCDDTGANCLRWWDGVEAEFAINSDTLYIRFRNGDDPNAKVIRAAPFSYYSRLVGAPPEFAPFLIHGQSNITINNFEIRGASSGVVISDGGANYNIIENNIISGADAVVHLWQNSGNPANGPQNNIIRNNLIFGDMLPYLTFQPKTHQQPPLGTYDRRISWWMYMFNKYYTGTSDEQAYGITISNAQNTEISGNEIYNKTAAIVISGGSTLIAGNRVHNINSGATFYASGYPIIPTYITARDNLIWEGGASWRTNDAGHPNGGNLTVDYYHNRVWSASTSAGEPIYISFTGGLPESQQNSAGTFRFYHNTFLNLGYVGSANTPSNQDIPNLLIVNNIFQQADNTIGFWQGGLQVITNAPGRFGYNWLYANMGDGSYPTNVISPSQVFSTASMPADWTPSGSALSAGIDVSKPFTVNGKTYSALPGFSPGYFLGIAPDIGAVQSGISPTPVPLPSPSPTPLRSRGGISRQERSQLMAFLKSLTPEQKTFEKPQIPEPSREGRGNRSTTSLKNHGRPL